MSHRTLILGGQGPTPRISFNQSSLETPSPNIVTLGGRASTQVFEGTQFTPLHTGG